MYFVYYCVLLEESAGQNTDPFGTWDEPYGGQEGGRARFSLMQQEEILQGADDQANAVEGISNEGHEGASYK